MARAELFWNLIAKKYSKQPIADESAYQIKIKKTQALLSSESVVLEFGCGTGSTALTHAPFVKSITALDYSQKMIDIAKVKAVGVGNVEFKKSTLAEHTCDPETYHLILGLNILHLLNNYEDAITKSFKLLKPGGYFITSTVCMSNATGIQRFLLSMLSALRVIPYLQFLDLSALEKEIRDAGLTIIESYYPGSDQNTVFIIAKK